MPKMGEMGHFGVQNKQLLTFLQISSLDFSEIMPIEWLKNEQK